MNPEDNNIQINKISVHKRKALISTRKAIGHITKVLKMIQDDKYCPEVIQQTDAVIGLLKATKKSLLTGHLNHCVEEKLKTDKKQTVEELLKIYELGNK